VPLGDLPCNVSLQLINLRALGEDLDFPSAADGEGYIILFAEKLGLIVLDIIGPISTRAAQRAIVSKTPTTTQATKS
jgi:hypothetical protein